MMFQSPNSQPKFFQNLFIQNFDFLKYFIKIYSRIVLQNFIPHFITISIKDYLFLYFLAYNSQFSLFNLSLNYFNLN
jgi:hypothetical protein